MAANDDGLFDASTNDPCEFSTESRFWNIFTGSELVTCAEFLACQDPLTKHFICDSSSVADSSIISDQRNESDIDRILRMNRDPPQTQMSGVNRKNALDPPQSSNEVTIEILPQELTYYTSPIATINNGNSYEKKATEWWHIPITTPTANRTEVDTSIGDQNQEYDKNIANFPELIDLTTYDMEDDNYVGSTATKMLSVSTVTQSLNLTTYDAMELESLPSLVSDRRDDFDNFPLDRYSVKSTKGSEPPNARTLRKSTLEPPGTIHPSQSISIPGGANSFIARLVATKSQIPGTSCENTIDLSYISASDPSMSGTRISNVRGVFSIPEEEPIVENTNKEQSSLFTIPTIESGTPPTIPTLARDRTTSASESTSSQIHENPNPQLPAPPSTRYLNEPTPMHPKPPKPPQYRRFDDSVSGQALAGVPYGVSDAATTNSSRISTITTEGDEEENDDDIDSKWACLDGEHGKPIRTIGSNDSVGSVAKNIGVIFVSNDFPAADVTRTQ
jgi:hypothetical protein